jgi:hypothetical protein
MSFNVIAKVAYDLHCGHCDRFITTVDKATLSGKALYKVRCEQCQSSNDFKIVGDCPVDVSVEHSHSYTGGARWVNALVLVETMHTEEPVQFLCETGFHCNSPELCVGLEELQNKRFYINENSVLTNTIPVLDIYRNKMSDPHDAIRLVTMWGPGDTDCVPHPDRLPIVIPDLHSVVEDDEFGYITLPDRMMQRFYRMEEETIRVRCALDALAPEAPGLFKEWCGSYGKSAQAWWVLLDQTNTESDSALYYEGGMWTGHLTNGVTVSYDTTSGAINCTLDR